MQSIVVALDEPWRESIEEAGGEIRAVTGRMDLAAATQPHFTLQVAERYGPAVDEALARVAGSGPAITFDTGRIGVFGGRVVVVALEVVRSSALLEIQARVVAAVAPSATGPKPAYDSETWAPHISIVAGQIAQQQIEAIMAVLARRDFAWRVPLTNICLVPGPRAQSWTRFDVCAPNA